MANKSEAFKKRRNNINSHHICQYWGIWWLLRTLHINWISECLEEMMELHRYQNVFSDIVPLHLIKTVFTLLSKQHNHTDLVYWSFFNSSACFGCQFQQTSGKKSWFTKKKKKWRGLSFQRMRIRLLSTIMIIIIAKME